jgi:SRSO17 transposase
LAKNGASISSSFYFAIATNENSQRPKYISNFTIQQKFISQSLPSFENLQLMIRLITSWRVDRDYEDLKQEIGLGHYEGRGWPGFHHHGTLAIAAYGFRISERERVPPQDHSPPLQSKNRNQTARPEPECKVPAAGDRPDCARQRSD